MKKPKYSIDEDIGVEWADEGLWRSYQVIGQGDTLGELYGSLGIAEIGQDGDTIDYYEVNEATDEIIDATYATMEIYLFKLIRGA